MHSLEQDVEVGHPARAQLATTMGGTKTIAQKLKGKAFVIETKFDGTCFSPKSAVHAEFEGFWTDHPVIGPLHALPLSIWGFSSFST